MKKWEDDLRRQREKILHDGLISSAFYHSYIDSTKETPKCSAVRVKIAPKDVEEYLLRDIDHQFSNSYDGGNYFFITM